MRRRNVDGTDRVMDGNGNKRRVDQNRASRIKSGFWLKARVPPHNFHCGKIFRHYELICFMFAACSLCATKLGQQQQQQQHQILYKHYTQHIAIYIFNNGNIMYRKWFNVVIYLVAVWPLPRLCYVYFKLASIFCTF